MKRTALILLMGLLAVGTAWAQPAYSVKDLLLENRDDSVRLGLLIGPGAAGLPSRATLVLTPIIRSDVRELALKPMVLRGKLSGKKYDRARFFGSRKPLLLPADGSLSEHSYYSAIPFAEWMRGARLELQSELYLCEMTGDPVRQTDILAGQIPVPPVAPPPVVRIVEVPSEPIVLEVRKVTGNAYLDFPVGQSGIFSDFHNNMRELDKIRGTLDTLLSGTHVRVASVQLIGYASPEGNVELNDRLSSERAQALKNYLEGVYPSLPRDKFTVQAGGEDWKGLRDLVAASDMEVKSAVLGILDSDLSPDAKKGRLKALAGGVPYNVLLKTYYPRLRRVEYTIGYEILQ